MIVKMVVHPPPGAALLLRPLRNFAEIPEVIVRQQDRHIIQHLPVLQAACLSGAIPIFLHFLIDSQHLRRMFKLIFLQQLLLRNDDLLQQLNIFAV
ncbi:hypothetical protein D3C73_1089170 [compost metagenome]